MKYPIGRKVVRKEEVYDAYVFDPPFNEVGEIIETPTIKPWSTQRMVYVKFPSIEEFFYLEDLHFVKNPITQIEKHYVL